MTNKVDFGVLYGQKTTEDALLIYSSYEDAKASPQTGDFIVLTPKDEGNTKFLARVEAEIYDEDPIFKSQDKTLIAVHYARIAERELSERDKQKMFSYTYKVRILGTFADTGTAISFTTAVRKLPTVSYIARHLNKREIESILNRENENGVAIGHLCVGETIFKELTRLTQEHYILGYPYPLAEAHNFISLRKDFKEEIISRLKYSLYKDQRMDNVDIENLFLDMHDRF